MTEQAQAGFLLVETQTGPTSDRFIGDGLALARSGRPVSLLLVADAVAIAVRGASTPLAEFVAAGGEVWVDGFTMEQRALPRRVLVDEVAVVDMDLVAGSLLATGVRTVWH